MGSADIRMERYSNVWEALEDTPFEAQRMRIKSDMMITIEKIIKDRGLTQAEAAAQCGVTQPRISDLLRGKIERFSIDSLLDILTALRCTVSFKVKASNKEAPPSTPKRSST